MSPSSTSATQAAVHPVEPLFHFVWYGEVLPDFALIAIASALRQNPGTSALLWHQPALKQSAALVRLQSQGLSLRAIDFPALLESAAGSEAPFDGSKLGRIYQGLKAPAARSNLLRLLVIYLYGGIYLDTDTLTLKKLDSLRALGGFCGQEHVLWPSGRSKFRPDFLLLDLLRLGYGRLPGGASLHRQLLRFYSQSANNAVLGLSRGHPFSAECLKAAAHIPEREWMTRYRFGTHLLQQQLAIEGASGARARTTQLPPDYFYPQGPVVSLHYFRKTRSPEQATKQLVFENTHVIHWYASVAQLVGRGSAHIRLNERREVYSHLCAPYLSLFE